MESKHLTHAEGGCGKNNAEDLQKLYEAIKENHERSYYILGKMYENGFFIKKDISKKR